MNQEKIGKFILECRKDKKMTQEELAQKLNITNKAISKWENGRCLMDISLLKPLSEILDVSIVELINGEKTTKDYQKESDNAIETTIKYANKKVKIAKIKSLLFILLTIIMIFLFYKSYFLIKYNVEPLKKNEYNEIINGLKNQNEMIIYKKTINDDEYITLNEIKIRNDFNNYTFIQSDNNFEGNKFYLYDNENNIKTSFWVSNLNTLIETFTNDELDFFGNIKENKFNNADRKYFLLKNDINNDIDFLNYIMNNYYIKNNLFTSTRNIKENYALNSYIKVILQKMNSLTIIKGDYEGYIFNYQDNLREVNILKNNKRYVFTFIGSDITNDNYIKDILSTLEIQYI